jgi:hypothetical protein
LPLPIAGIILGLLELRTNPKQRSLLTAGIVLCGVSIIISALIGLIKLFRALGGG